jgi:hypothetical protein
MRAELVLACLVVATPAIARAGEPTAHDRAAQSFEQARSAFARRDFTAAALAFEQAAEYEPHPIAWLDAAEAWTNAGEPVRAAIACDRILDDPATPPRFRREAEQRLGAVAREVATVDVRGREGTRAALDGGADFAVPARRRTRRGAHELAIVEPGAGGPRRIPITVRGGETVVVDLSVAPAEPPPRPSPSPAPAPPAVSPPAPTRSGPPLASWIAFGAAGVGAAATTFFGIRTSSARDDFDRAPTADHRDAFYGERLATNVSLALAAGALLTGVVLWIAAPSGHRTRAGLP